MSSTFYMEPNSTRVGDALMEVTIEVEDDEGVVLFFSLDREVTVDLMNAHGEIALILKRPEDVDAFEKAVVEACAEFRAKVLGADA